MQRSRSTKAVTSLAALCLTACAHKPVVVPVTNAALATTDGLPGGDQRPELLAHGERLCVALAHREQRALGFRAATRALSLAPEDRVTAFLVARCAFLTADFETDAATIVALTDAGLTAIQKADPTGKDPLAAYYRALLLGMAVRLKGLDAIGELPKILDALKLAKESPDVDLGGPLRVLLRTISNKPP